MTNRELLQTPEALLSELDRQRVFLLRTEGTRARCPAERRTPMPQAEGKRPVTVVSAVMRPDGVADFAITRAEVTDDEIADGIHLYRVEADLPEAGYEEPFVHFPQGEAPPFLLPA